MMSRFAGLPTYALVFLALAGSVTPSGGQVYQLSGYQVQPFSGACVVGGTKFPWYDRFGNFVSTITGTFQFYGAFNVTASQIAVTVNGQQAQVTQDPNNPQQGTWAYMNGASPISVGPGPSFFALTVVYSYNGQPISNGGTVNLTYTVYAVLPITIGNPNFGGTSTDDWVGTTSNLRLVSTTDPGPNGSIVDRLKTDTAAVSLPDTNTRQTYNGFQVIGPPGTAAPPFTVGIIQTKDEESQMGCVKYTQTENPAVTGTMQFVVVPGAPPLPWWDGYPDVPCYYSASAVRFVPGNTTQGTNGNNQPTGTSNAPLTLDDTPSVGLLNGYKYDGDGLHYDWGIFTMNQRALVGQSRYNEFEDMLVASSSDVVNVVIPIYGYLKWSTTFAGYLNTGVSPAVWVGGNVQSMGPTGTIQPVEIQSRGPADALQMFHFQVP